MKTTERIQLVSTCATHLALTSVLSEPPVENGRSRLLFVLLVKACRWTTVAITVLGECMDLVRVHLPKLPGGLIKRALFLPLNAVRHFLSMLLP